MEKLNAGALVIYRTKPALITALDGDKIESQSACFHYLEWEARIS